MARPSTQHKRLVIYVTDRQADRLRQLALEHAARTGKAPDKSAVARQVLRVGLRHRRCEQDRIVARLASQAFQAAIAAEVTVADEPSPFAPDWIAEEPSPLSTPSVPEVPEALADGGIGASCSASPVPTLPEPEAIRG